MSTFSPDRYDHMQYRRSGRSGLKLPAISLGCWETYGGYCDDNISRECLFKAFDLGITHFDLANNYGRPPGNAETVVGRILKEMPRDELIISSKAGYRMWPGPYGEMTSKKYLVSSLDQSLKRLQLDYVDIFYAHRPDYETPLEETMGALELIVRQGKALYAGVSNFPGAHFEQSVRVMEQIGKVPVTIHQPSYSMLNRRPETDLFEHTERNGVGVIVFSPLAQGLLTDKYLNGIPADSRAALWWTQEHAKKRITTELVQKLQKLNAIAASRNQTLAQMAIAWILRLPAVTSVLIGASKPAQIEENVRALSNIAFSQDELSQIDALTLH